MKNKDIRRKCVKFFTELSLELTEKQKAKLRSVEYIAYCKFTPIKKKK